MITSDGQLSPPSSPSMLHRRKSFWRKLEHCCCNTFAYFPLLFVYGLTTWAVYVEVSVSFFSGTTLFAYIKAALGVVLYTLANTSYSIAVFTDAGSPLDQRRDLSVPGDKRRQVAGYAGLPTHESQDEEIGQAADMNMTAVTAKSSGQARYCKKCRCVKPDRTHHCSACGRCVLKMDHHCPWLATCVGLRNYKPFLLFLIYTSLFCWLCFAVTATWVWRAITDNTHMEQGMRIVNTILLAVLGGVIGLVLSGFTGWHLYLVINGQTTIESLEKTRYLSPLKEQMEEQFKHRAIKPQEGGVDQSAQTLLEHLKETHANALPGVLRPEEGEDEDSRATTPLPAGARAGYAGYTSSPARESLQQSFASLEAQRERDRYANYLDEQDSERLPNAFDLGRRRNVQHVFGTRPLLWFLPVCNTSGDGWMWEVNPDWTKARAELGQKREQRERDENLWRSNRGPVPPPPRQDFLRWTPGQGFTSQHPSRQDSQMQMQPLDRRKTSPGGSHDSDGVDSYDTSSDEDAGKQRRSNGTSNWNDLPQDMLTSRNSGHRSRSRGRRKGKGD